MSSRDLTPFRFLNIPRDIRFMIYDCLPIIKCHHSVTALARYTRAPYSLTVVSYLIPGISRLGLCRFIHASAVLLSRKVAAINASPLRIIRDWRSLGGTAMCAMTLCALKLPCKDGRHLEIVLGIPIEESTNMVRRDFDTHEELHDILRSSEFNNRPRAVEIAVVWGHSRFETRQLEDTHLGLL